MLEPREHRPFPRRIAVAILIALVFTACRDDEQLKDSLADTKQALSKNTKKLRAVKGMYEVSQGALEEQTDKLNRAPGTLAMKVAFEFAGEALEIEKPYEIHGDTVSVGSLRYWLSNVALRSADGDWVSIKDTYYLMEHAQKIVDPKAQEIEYVPHVREELSMREVPGGSYDGVHFCVGVDQEHNDDLTLSGGELNVLSNMAEQSWMWFTSYIFTSVYGHMTPSTFGPGEEPVIIGWQTGGNDELRCMDYDLPNRLRVGFERDARIELALDVSHLFDYMTAKVIADSKLYPETPSSYLGPSDLEAATVISQNWRDAFLVKSACCDDGAPAE